MICIKCFKTFSPPPIKLCTQVSQILFFWKWMPRLWMVVVAVDLAVNFTQGARQWCSWLEGGGNLGTVTFQYFSSIFSSRVWLFSSLLKIFSLCKVMFFGHVIWVNSAKKEKKMNWSGCYLFIMIDKERSDHSMFW